ncbi:hypothetical protein CBM2634_P140002 [Cupriavidus taiwanensis]|uniref:Uncharacterized protein n=1 Tax=Cupriavidus taiwanensis TaxID=164546 RepID=A0A375JAN4_9BURK|nr:hypothetical protein CBM2634_P140002 [Cupriavidus taiwanensis]
MPAVRALEVLIPKAFADWGHCLTGSCRDRPENNCRWERGYKRQSMPIIRVGVMCLTHECEQNARIESTHLRCCGP